MSQPSSLEVPAVPWWVTSVGGLGGTTSAGIEYAVGPPGPQAPSSPQNIGRMLHFDQVDTNRDGVIDRHEWEEARKPGMYVAVCECPPYQLCAAACGYRPMAPCHASPLSFTSSIFVSREAAQELWEPDKFTHRSVQLGGHAHHAWIAPAQHFAPTRRIPTFATPRGAANNEHAI